MNHGLVIICVIECMFNGTVRSLILSLDIRDCSF